MSKFDDSVGNNLLKVDGTIYVKLGQVLKEKDMTRYRLSKMTGIRYDTICNYCNNKVALINKEYLKIFCSVLDCELSDIIEYRK